MSDSSDSGRIKVSKIAHLSKYKKRKWREKSSTSVSSSDDPDNLFKKKLYKRTSDSRIPFCDNDKIPSKRKKNQPRNEISTESPSDDSIPFVDNSVEMCCESNLWFQSHTRSSKPTSDTGTIDFSPASVVNNEELHCQSAIQNSASSSSDDEVEHNNIQEGFPTLTFQNYGNRDRCSFSEVSTDATYEDCSYGGDSYRYETTAHFTKLINTLSQDDYNDIIDVPAAVSKADVLLGVVKDASVKNTCHSGLVDTFKMLNCFFGDKLFPDSRYLVDQLLNSNSFVEFHALCPICKKYVKKFDAKEREAKCSLCNEKFLLHQSTYTDFFVMFKFENQMRDLLESNSKHFNSVRHSRMEQTEKFEDFTDGLLYKNFISELPEERKTNFASLTINSDGSPVFKSSKFSVWPIQAIINELPYELRILEVIICGLWFSNSKPDMNIFLDPFVDNIIKMSRDGIPCTIENQLQNIYVYALCCCVDSGARPSMQGLTQYNGYFGCNWCLHPGVYVETETGGCVKFPLTDELPPNRTEAQMLNDMFASLNSREPRRGVKRPSALINVPGYNIVWGFVPDPLHCVNMGLCPQFMDLWDSSGKPYSLSKADMEYIDYMLKNMKVPNHVQRLTRTISDRSFWKGLEWENWILHYSVPILLSIPHMRRYAEHWMLLVEAYYILLKQSITFAELDRAHELLKHFVVDTQRLYYQNAMTFNVHQLLHLTQSVVNWGPLHTHSGYCFESGNGNIVRMIHAAKGVIHQICRSVAMKQSLAILKKHAETNSRSRILSFVEHLEQKKAKHTLKISDARYFGQSDEVDEKWARELHLSEDAEVYYKMVKNRCLFTSSEKPNIRSDNSFAVTTEGRFISIRFFIIDTETSKEFTICRTIQTREISNQIVDHAYEIVHISIVEEAIETNSIDCVCVMVEVNNMKYLSKIPNLYYS